MGVRAVRWLLVAAVVALVWMQPIAAEAAADDKAAETYKFQAEVTRLMDILIHSLYTNRDVFLRELISNGNDAIDKIRFQSLTNATALEGKEELEIRIFTDPESRTVTVEDSGIGMTKADMVNNLGTIAKSGTANFLQKISEDQKEGGVQTANLIGQFGVGFYSAFLVAERVTVISKNNADTQWRWSSDAQSGFSIKPDDSEPLGRGTRVILQLREDADEYLEPSKLEKLIKQYSEFIVFPIHLRYEGKDPDGPQDDDDVDEYVDLEDEGKGHPIDSDREAEEDKDEAEEQTDTTEKQTDATEEGQDEEDSDEIETLEEDAEDSEKAKPYYYKQVNNLQALWRRDPSEVTDDEYKNFFKSMAKTDKDPLTWMHFKAEGDVEFRGLLFIPKEPLKSMNDAEGIQHIDLVRLYVKRVLVTDHIEYGLLPSWLSFVIGIVDSDDLPINVSRETLQESSTLQAIQKKLLRKALEAIKGLMDKEKSKDSTEDSTEDSQEDSEEAPKENSEEAPKEESSTGGKPDTPYLDFWKVYSSTIKMGLVRDEANRDRVSKLLRFQTSKTNLTDDNDVVTFDEYLERMKTGQEYIYVHSGETAETVDASPFCEQLKDLDYEILYLTDPVDEYLLQYYPEHQGMKFMSAAKDNFRLGAQDDEVVRAKAKKGKERIKDLLKWLKETLGTDKVRSVRTSMKLTKSPCAMSTEQYGYTARMETVMRAQALGNPKKSVEVPNDKIMEVNPYHPIILGLARLVEKDANSTKAVDVAHTLYDSALVASGYFLSDHTEHGLRVSRLMAELVGIDPNAKFEEPPMPEMEPEGAEGAEGAEESSDTPELDIDDMDTLASVEV